MTTSGTDTLDFDALQAFLGPELTADQAALIFQQGQEAVVFALLTLAKLLFKKQALATSVGPSTPSRQTPPYAKPTVKGRAKNKCAKPGHQGHRRAAPPRIAPQNPDTHKLTEIKFPKHRMTPKFTTFSVKESTSCVGSS